MYLSEYAQGIESGSCHYKCTHVNTHLSVPSVDIIRPCTFIMYEGDTRCRSRRNTLNVYKRL